MCLKDLFDKHGTDRGSFHSYGEVYEKLFQNVRDSSLNILEIGIGTHNTKIPYYMHSKYVPGAGLRTWREYFPNAQIFGADIDSSILFVDDRIQTQWVDQTKIDKLNQLFQGTSFDIIIDDGYHEYEPNRITFECLKHRVNSSGWYVIEDVKTHLLNTWRAYFTHHNIPVTIHRLNPRLPDDNLIIIPL